MTHLYFSQTYKPIDTADYKERKLFLTNYTKNNEEFSKFIKSKYNGEVGRYLTKNYDDFQKEFRVKIKDKDFHHKSQFNVYVSSLIAKLRAKNPSIPNNLQILIEKNNSPNAASIGDGTVIVNMGLLNWLDSEEQLLAVLGHELAHQLLQHSIKWQEKGFIADKSSKSKVNEINKSKINKSEKAFSLFRDIVYNNSTERRKNEIQADSLGFVLFKNAGFKKADYKNALKNLQLFDTISPKKVEKEFYSVVFNLPNSPFKESWLKMEDFSAYNYKQFKEKLNKDSISSHPEIQNRIEKLIVEFPELKDNSETKIDGNSEFAQLKKIAQWEVAPNYFYAEEYGLGIYALLQLKSNNELKDEKYFDTWLGKYFTKIAEARKNYKLNRYLDRLEPQKQDISYQQFLSFMWNLSLDDISKIAEYYNKKSS